MTVSYSFVHFITIGRVQNVSIYTLTMVTIHRLVNYNVLNTTIIFQVTFRTRERHAMYNQETTSIHRDETLGTLLMLLEGVVHYCKYRVRGLWLVLDLVS